MGLKIIGITGKSGVGKTTFSKYLSENLEKVKVLGVDTIHIHYLLSQQKDKLIHLFGDDIIVNGKLNTKYFIQFPEKQKIIFDESFDDLDTILLKEIEIAKETYNWIVIDFFRLSSLKKVWDLCEYHILIEALSDDKRYENIAMRYKKMGSNINRTKEEEFKLRDYFTQNYHDYKYDFYLLNNYDSKFEQEIDMVVKELVRINNM